MTGLAFRLAAGNAGNGNTHTLATMNSLLDHLILGKLAAGGGCTPAFVSLAERGV